jgi:hypothetical protein
VMSENENKVVVERSLLDFGLYRFPLMMCNELKCRALMTST